MVTRSIDAMTCIDFNLGFASSYTNSHAPENVELLYGTTRIKGGATDEDELPTWAMEPLPNNGYSCGATPCVHSYKYYLQKDGKNVATASHRGLDVPGIRTYMYDRGWESGGWRVLAREEGGIELTFKKGSYVLYSNIFMNEMAKKLNIIQQSSKWANLDENWVQFSQRLKKVSTATGATDEDELPTWAMEPLPNDGYSCGATPCVHSYKYYLYKDGKNVATASHRGLDVPGIRTYMYDRGWESGGWRVLEREEDGIQLTFNKGGYTLYSNIFMNEKAKTRDIIRHSSRWTNLDENWVQFSQRLKKVSTVQTAPDAATVPTGAVTTALKTTPPGTTAPTTTPPTPPTMIPMEMGGERFPTNNHVILVIIILVLLMSSCAAAFMYQGKQNNTS